MNKRSEWLRRGIATMLTCAMVVTLFPLHEAFAAQTSQAAVQSTDFTENKEYPKTKEALHQKLKSLCSFYGVTSAQYAIIDHGEITLSGSAGYANKEAKLAPTESTMYGIGSISKIFTTVAVMQLVEAGKIELDEPVTTYLPEFVMKDERYRDITVRMLLNHTSGLLGSSLSSGMLYGDQDLRATESLLDTLSKERLKSDPGVITSYCNDGFTLAELVVERVTGKSFTSYIHQQITSPLELKSIFTAGERFVSRKLARIYTPLGKNLPYEVLGSIGAGGLYSTAEDLCKFAKIFMEDSNGFLSKESVDAMMAPEYASTMWYEDSSNALNFGLGWDNVRMQSLEKYGIKALEKSGDTNYYHGDLIVLPEEKIAIAILSVGGSSVYHQLVAQEALLTYLEEKGQIERTIEEEPLLNPEIKQETMPTEYEEFRGYYGNNSTVCKVEVSDQTMVFENLSYQNAVTFQYYGDGWFVYKDLCAIRFIKENGTVYLYIKERSSLPSIGSSLSGVYFAQKLEDYEVNPEDIQAWLDRADEVYYIVNEKYSSYIYSMDLMPLTLLIEDYVIMDQYLWNLKVIDANTMIMDYQIPMVRARDLSDYKVFTKDGAEYFAQNEFLYISKKSIQDMPLDTVWETRIKEDGYGRYYQVPKELSGKTIHVKMPEDAAFMIYDRSGKLRCNSYLEHKTSATVDARGYLLLLGDAGTEFKITVME